MAVNLRPTLHPVLAPVVPFMPYAELAALDYALKGEEAVAIVRIVAGMAATIGSMPRTYPHAPLGDAAIVHLHYFKGDSHWYVTELDRDGAAFGFVVINGDLQNAAPRFVNIGELVLRGAELDLYWTKRTLGELKLQVLP